MIGSLTGTAAEVRADRVVVDVQGVGYEVWMTPKAIAGLPAVGERMTVHTHLHVRDDDLSLYGFVDYGDRDLFRILLGVSGVGPRVALAVLGVFAADALLRAVAAEDVKALTQVPGIGTRGAQRMILDLRPKLADLESRVVGDGSGPSSQVREALEGLGYTNAEAREVMGSIDGSSPVPEQIRQALRELGARR
jgi:holliday junction DNA helicase RuvA